MSDINEMNVGPRWYVAHTYSGYENKVKANLEKIIENRGLGHLIFDIRIPVEIVVEKNGDVEKEVETKLFPCYVYVKMVMNEESWHAVRNITGVTGFVGPGSRPTPLTDEQFDGMRELGKFAFGVHYNENEIDEAKAIETAVEAVADGLVRVFKGNEEITELDSELEITDGDVFTFVRLTMLSGRMW